MGGLGAREWRGRRLTPGGRRSERAADRGANGGKRKDSPGFGGGAAAVEKHKTFINITYLSLHAISRRR